MYDGTLPLPLENQLPADAYWHLVRTLRLTLPPPPDDTPEALTRRDHAAVAAVVALAPADAAEAKLAAQFVAASEQWNDCLHLAQTPGITKEWAAKCRAQAAAMMRQANAALRLLLRMQAARAKLDNAAADRRAWTEHTATRLMAEALAAQPSAANPAQPPAEAAAAAEPQLPAPEPKPEPALDPDLTAAIERYTATYPERAAQILRTRKLPCDVRYFDPPEAAVACAMLRRARNTPEALRPPVAGGSPAPAAPDCAADPEKSPDVAVFATMRR